MLIAIAVLELVSRNEVHSRIRLLPTRRQPRGQIPHVQFQLVPVRVEKIERRPFAFVLFPDGYACVFKLLREGVQMFWLDGEGVMSVVALLRRNEFPRVVIRQTEPEIAAGEICPGVPFGVQAQAKEIAPEGDADRQIADGEGQVVEGVEHEVHSWIEVNLTSLACLSTYK